MMTAMKQTSKAIRRTKHAAMTRPTLATRDKYVLRLFVAGVTVRSRQAIVQVRELCETTLKGRVELEVIDIYQQPRLARENQIVATPTLVVASPLPVRRFIGSLTTIDDLFRLFDVDDKREAIL
jgi:circadian clock protein KaiB